MYKRRNLTGTRLKRSFLVRSGRRYLQLLATGLTSWELQFTEASVLRYIRPKRPDQSFDDRIVDIEEATPGRTSERFVANQLTHILSHWPPNQWPSHRSDPFDHLPAGHNPFEGHDGEAARNTSRQEA